MSLIRYVPRSRMESGTLTFGKQTILFNSNFHKEFLNNCDKVALYYDEERREVVIEPQLDGTGIVVMQKGVTRAIRIAGFCKFFKICVDRTMLKKAVKRDGAIVIQL